MDSSALSPDSVDFIASDPQEITEALEALGPVDIVVGIPSYNEADNIAFVVEQCDEGLRRFFRDRNTLLLNVDNDSQDDTKGVFLGVQTETPKYYISTPPGVRGKGNNFFNLFKAALTLEARAVVCVDADLESIGPDWIDDLASPVIHQGADYVTPVYSRNEYDGAITNHICYPLIYGLLGREVRQPIGGDFGLSGRFAAEVLSRRWEHTTHEYGIDIFLTLSAITGGFRVGQTRLGAKIHKPSAPKLGPMITQVLTTLFAMLVENKKEWRWNNGGAATERTYGDKRLEEPQALPVDYKGIKETALDGYEDQRRNLREFLTPLVFDKVDEIMVSGRMRLTSALWTRAVYDLLFAFDTSGKDERVIEAMKPLFFARIASFIRYTLDLDHEESEVEIRLQAREFRRLRRYLRKRYSDGS